MLYLSFEDGRNGNSITALRFSCRCSRRQKASVKISVTGLIRLGINETHDYIFHYCKLIDSFSVEEEIIQIILLYIK